MNYIVKCDFCNKEECVNENNSHLHVTYTLINGPQVTYICDKCCEKYEKIKQLLVHENRI